jgi:hypothetical protein
MINYTNIYRAYNIVYVSSNSQLIVFGALSVLYV